MSQTKERRSKTTDILLPSDEYILQSWKVKTGNVVRAGETIAIACKKDAAPATQGATKPAAPASHKRPNRRRRMNAAAIAAAAKSNPTTKAPDSTKKEIKPSATAILHQRLAEKLNGDKKDKPQPAKQPSNSVKPTLQSTSSNNSSSGGDAEKKNSETDTNTTTATVPIVASSNGILHTSKNPSTNLEEAKQKLCVGYIEECLHPGFFEGLCIVCGSSIMKEDSDNFLETSAHAIANENVNPVDPTVQVTVSGGITMTMSKREGQEIAQQDNVRLSKQKKLSLVLDLDHTLVHATSDPRAVQYATPDDVRILRLPALEGVPMPPPSQQHLHHAMMWRLHYVKLRPFIKEFLEGAQSMYELTVYTAGTRQYAEEITIVLCRFLVGASKDLDELDRLRYQVATAEAEYAKHSSLKDPLSQETQDMDIDKKLPPQGAPEESEASSSNSEPPKKRKKVSFGPPQSTDEKTAQEQNLRSDQMTLERLDALRKDLKESEELEKQAWDLRQKVFGSRVVSRTDVGDLGRDVKSLKRIFPCGGQMAAVVDDREDVWANASDNSADTIKGEPPENLLLVKPYHWQPFHGFADVNNAAGADLSGSGSGGNGPDPTIESDVQLQWTFNILKQLHKRYYAFPEGNRKTVPEILAQMRREVLVGKTLVLSGLVPLHKKVVGENSARPPIVRYAQKLGSTLIDKIQPGVTHLVAAKDGTDKALAARKIPGCLIVKPAWLVECYWSFTRRDTKPYLMGKGVGDQTKTVPSSDTNMDVTMQNGGGDDDDDDDSDSDDDALAAEFEKEMMGT